MCSFAGAQSANQFTPLPADHQMIMFRSNGKNLAFKECLSVCSLPKFVAREKRGGENSESGLFIDMPVTGDVSIYFHHFAIFHWPQQQNKIYISILSSMHKKRG